MSWLLRLVGALKSGSQGELLGSSAGFLHRSSLGLAIVSLLILTPFSINNFIEGRALLGVGSLAIIAFLAFNAWSITTRGRYYSTLTLVGLVPAIVFFLAVSLLEQGIIGVFWCYPAVLAFYFMLPERKAWTANAALLIVLVPLVWTELPHALALRMVATLLTVSVFSAIFIRVITEQQARLQAEAVTDPLTGVLNRTLLQSYLVQAIQQSNRTGVPMTLVAIDLDHFKSINDTLGHNAGDKVLRGVGELLLKRCRLVDKVFRLGGEEFLTLLYGTDAKNGQRVAEDLRSAVSSLALLPGRPITASMGVATLRSTEDWRRWMERSDENLYQAKVEGRDRVVA